jgi:general nucleoside transport system permease protein
MTRNRSLTLQIALTVIPIIVSLVITALLILAVQANPREVFEKVWEGAFRNGTSFAGVVNFWIPLTLASMGLIITFTAGLWNIGVEGQMMVGALFASWAAQFLPLPNPILVPIEILLAMLGGMLWALLVGVLKTRLGVHEIFGGVALNSLATVFTIYLISGPWQPEIGGSAQATEPFPVDALLPPISPEFPVSLLGIILTVTASVAVMLVLRGTRWGLQLKATGKNARSALLLGVPTERSALTALMACGALAGIAGAYRVLFTYGALRPLSSGGIGFLGLLVVLLVTMRALWTPFVAFAFAVILAGSTRLKVSLQLDQSLAGVLQGTLVLLVLLFNGLRSRLLERASAETQDVLPTTPERGGSSSATTATTEAH